ncbi:hypothetical protein ACM66B_003317 [Microbotryomycetes sp. NB124-2]
MHGPFDRVKASTARNSSKFKRQPRQQPQVGPDTGSNEPPPYAATTAAAAKVHDWKQQQLQQHRVAYMSTGLDVHSVPEQRSSTTKSRKSTASVASHRDSGHRATNTHRTAPSERRHGKTTDGGASESGMSLVSRFHHDAGRTSRHSSSSFARKLARQQTDSPLRTWTSWLERLHQHRQDHVVLSTKRVLLVTAVASAVAVKYAAGVGSYSGFSNPPMRGDFEAQRHWIALTSSSIRSPLLYPSAANATVSVKQWYSHDLQYWGLDYPPLTAYHSVLLGIIARLSQKTAAYTTLRPVSGLGNADETARWHQQISALELAGGLKHFMRTTVIASDLVIYITAVLWYCWTNHRGEKPSRSSAKSKRNRHALVAILTVLLQPALILTDNGHFQYNSVMLGSTLWSVSLLQSGHDLLGSIAFVCAIGFKQMALYYSPAIFACLLGKCLYRGGRDGLTLFVKLAIVTLGTFAAMLWPFLYSLASLQQVAHRVFPFARGLFEDKVANVWCALNVVIKLRQVGTISSLAKLALAATLAAVLPSVLGVLWISHAVGRRRDQSSRSQGPVSPSHTDAANHGVPPTSVLLPHALFLSAMAFFLFSFQVHEKSILLPLMPLTLLMGGREAGTGRLDWEWGALINNVGVFSMWPLLKRDGLALQYVALLALWNFAIGYNPLRLRSSFVKVLSLVTYALAAIIHLLECISTPPAHLPDLFIVANVGLSVTVFGLSFLWASKRLVQESWVVAS